MSYKESIVYIDRLLKQFILFLNKCLMIFACVGGRHKRLLIKITYCINEWGHAEWNNNGSTRDLLEILEECELRSISELSR